MNSADKCQGFPESYKISFRRILSEVRQANRAVITSFRIAESMGSKGEFRQWEHLLALPVGSSLAN